MCFHSSFHTISFENCSIFMILSREKHSNFWAQQFSAHSNYGFNSFSNLEQCFRYCIINRYRRFFFCVSGELKEKKIPQKCLAKLNGFSRKFIKLFFPPPKNLFFFRENKTKNWTQQRRPSRRIFAHFKRVIKIGADIWAG